MTAIFIKTKDTYEGNSQNRVWPISYPFLSVQELRVSVINPAGIGAYVNKNLRYDAENACIVYPTKDSDLQPLGEGWTICIERQAPIVRDANMPIKSKTQVEEDLTPLEHLGCAEAIRAIKGLKRVES
nr:MAG TPA: tail fiber protein [Caudoviricetes sp.]